MQWLKQPKQQKERMKIMSDEVKGVCTPQDIYIRGANKHRAEIERKIAEYNLRHETHFQLAEGNSEALTVGSYWGMTIGDLRAF